jgi:hypothetical protein
LGTSLERASARFGRRRRRFEKSRYDFNVERKIRRERTRVTNLKSGIEPDIVNSFPSLEEAVDTIDVFKGTAA